VIAALAPGLGVLIVGYSGLQGVGSALMIPPIYILATLAFADVQSRARAFGVISGMGGDRGCRRTADRGSDHHDRQLASLVPAPGPRRRDDHLPQPQDHRSPARGSDAPI
jgi:hypothetical protein